MANDLEETKLDQTEETNLEATEDTNPEGREEGGGEASEQSVQPSLEERLAAIEKKNQDLLRGMNDAQRTAAQVVAERDHYQRMAQAASGQLQQQTDPEAAAEAQYRAILEEDGFVSDRALAARDQLTEARLTKRDRNLMHQILEAQRINAELPQAQAMIQAADVQSASQQLAAVKNSLTPTELAKIALDRQGTLGDYYQSQQQEKEAAAKQAEALQSLQTTPGGRVVPGANAARKEKKTMDWVSFTLLPKETQRAIEASDHIEIVNVPGS